MDEFSSLSQAEKAVVITNMVEDLAKETGLPVSVCVSIIATYKGWRPFQVERYVKMVDPNFFYQVAFFDDMGNKVYERDIIREAKLIFNKIKPCVFADAMNGEVDTLFVERTIWEFYNA